MFSYLKKSIGTPLALTGTCKTKGKGEGGVLGFGLRLSKFQIMYMWKVRTSKATE